MDTLLLDRTTWDLVLDVSGNIALASEPYSIAQDVASACRLFLGELFYNTARGVAYFQQILGQDPSQQILRAQLEAIALTVPDVISARVVITSFSEREVRGQVQVIDVNGIESGASL